MKLIKCKFCDHKSLGRVDAIFHEILHDNFKDMGIWHEKDVIEQEENGHLGDGDYESTIL